MAVFEIAHKETMGNEGGYAFNPSDAGGETYKGIARKFHPMAAVWRFVDNIKSGLTTMPEYGRAGYYAWAKNFNRNAAANPALQKAVLDFYEINFWHQNSLNNVQSQKVANQMYDWAVNTGTRGNVWIQKSLELTPDGSIGPKSLAAINAADPDSLLLTAREYAKAHRLKVCEKNPDQKQFLAGWLSRDGFSQEEIREIVA